MSSIVAPKLSVLISGAGIAGPVLAYWLTRTRHDISIKIVERSPIPRVTGQAIDIEGGAVQIVKKMQLLDAIRARHTTETGTVVHNTAGKPFATFGTGDMFTSKYEILRADLSQLLLEKTEALRNVQYIYGDHVSAMKQSEKKVDIEFAKGGNDSFDLVVAADGSLSKIRSMILNEEETKNCYNFIGQYTAFFSIPSRPSDDKLWHGYRQPKGLGLNIRPHRNPETIGAYMTITTPGHGIRDPVVEEALNSGTAATKKMLHSYFSNTGWQSTRILEGMDAAHDFYMSRAALVKLPKWTNGRVALIGDAAFATFGVGTTLAIEAGYYLAGEISKIRGTDEIPRALISYEEEFRKVYKKSGDFPPGFPQLGSPQTRWGLMVRNAVMWGVAKSKVYRLFMGAEGKKDDEVPAYEWVD